ncbi:HinT-interacting membrane complex lipoprotein P60 [Mycoplasmopsis gallinacea]|uniref:P60-like lipoprotein n=1 Tax=Mycoplasmopsis gallinacea TaxID=29556 RepID=A0A6H0V3M2_9BACT|nr:hypothetical protein [Mycoplasmopsis gallinacea]QIW62066.1 hypothetical protein GOQ20_01150 [Mycoplasmopsis gallinacea]
MAFSFRNKLAPLALATVPAIALASCGRTEDTTAKVEQDAKFKNESIKKVMESFWLKSTLQSIYNTSDDLTKNDQYLNDAFLAYKATVSYNNISNPYYLYEQINSWNADGIFTAAENEALNSLRLSNSNVNKEQFKIIFNNNSTNIDQQVNKLILVLKYFQISSDEQLKKVNNSFETNKENFQHDQFNLISYVLNKKVAQVWNYKSSSSDDIFANSARTISNVSDYLNLTLNSSVNQNKVSVDLLFNSQNSFELKLGGYLGLVDSSKVNAVLNYTVSDLKQSTINTSGFYDFSNNKIVTVDQNETLATPIAASNDGSTINVVYLNQIVPVKKDVTEGDKTTSILSFDNTVYASDLTKLELLLALSDNTLYGVAQEAFVKLGNVLEIKNDTIKETLGNLSFIK